MRLRALVIVPVAVALATCGALACCGAAGVRVSWHDALLAAIVCTAAAELAFLPIVLVRRVGHGSISQVAASQAALAGTMVHLFVTFAAACILVLSPSGLRAQFLIWTMGLYGLTLGLLIVFLVREIRAASGPSAFGMAQVTQNTKP